MRVRYENCEGPKGDWLVSRQRWCRSCCGYRVDADDRSTTTTSSPPLRPVLPVDPSTDVPEGYTEDQRACQGERSWTRMPSPQLACGWLDDEDRSLCARREYHSYVAVLHRGDLSSVRCRGKHAGLWLDPGFEPQENVEVQGQCRDPHGHLGSTVRRRIGVACLQWMRRSTSADEDWPPPGDLACLNASKFALTMGAGEARRSIWDPALVTVPLDRSVPAALASVIDEASAALASYEHLALDAVTESFFWTFWQTTNWSWSRERAYNRDGGTVPAASARGSWRSLLLPAVYVVSPRVARAVAGRVRPGWRRGRSGALEAASPADRAASREVRGEGNAARRS